jgi:hypothetical protein
VQTRAVLERLGIRKYTLNFNRAVVFCRDAPS